MPSLLGPRFFCLVMLSINIAQPPFSSAFPINRFDRRIDINENLSNLNVNSELQLREMNNTISSKHFFNSTKESVDLTIGDRNNGSVRMVPLVGSRQDSYRPDTYIVLLYSNATAASYVEKLRSVLEKKSENATENVSEESQIGYVYSDNILHGFSARLVGKGLEFVRRSPEVSQCSGWSKSPANNVKVDWLSTFLKKKCSFHHRLFDLEGIKVKEMFPDTKMTTLPVADSIQEIFEPSKVHSESAEDSTNSTDSGGDYLIQQGTAPWNLQRISQRPKIHENGRDVSKTTYNYYHQVPDGKGTVIYVLDTGVRASHKDLEGRVEFAAVFGGYDKWDGNGHGTHCAGVITGHRWGVAKQAKVRAIKVMSDEGEGAASDIIAAIQYIIEQYQASGYQPTIASLSLGGHRNRAFDGVVQKAINQGIHFVVASGNENVNSCQSSPAACPDANVVAASDINDTRAPYSNWGPCVDLFAPGSNITSTWYSSDTAVARISGTSMAAPHVAALMAYHLSQHNMTTKAMTEMLKRNANHGALSLRSEDPTTHEGVAATPNLLVYNMVG